MRKIIFSVIFLVSVLGLFAQGAVSSECDKLIADFFQLRLELTAYDQVLDSAKARAEIDVFVKEHEVEFNSLSEDEQLAVENFYVNEYYNFLYLDSKQKNTCRDMMKAQLLKNEAFCKDKTDAELNKWLLVTYGDVTSCSMAFSMKDVMKYGLSIKPLYERAIALDPDFFYSNMNLGQWYYWAPGMAGGSKKKALTFSKKAVDCARSDAEKYYANLMYSQLLFENKDKEGAARSLEAARKIFPESKIVNILVEENAKGKSLFEYNKDRSDLKEEK